MAIYIILFLIALFAMFFVDKKINIFNREIIIKQQYYLYVAMISLFLISALRFEVGTDYLRYRDLYLQNLYPMEFFMEIINNIARFFGNYQIVIIFSAAVANIGIFYILKKEEINVAIASFVYVSFGFYTMLFNIFRQGNAMVLILVSVYFLTKKNYRLYAVFGVLATLTHSTALFVWLFITVVYFLMIYFRKYITSKNLVIVLGVAITMIIFLPQVDILKNITTIPFLETVSQRYLVTDNPFVIIREIQITTIIRYLMQAGLFVVLLKGFDNTKEKTSEFKLLAIVLSVGYIVAIALKQDSEIVNRLLVYFQIFYVFSIPYLISRYIKSGKMQKWIAIGFLILIGGIIFVITLMNNAGGIIPYQLIGLF